MTCMEVFKNIIYDYVFMRLCIDMLLIIYCLTISSGIAGYHWISIEITLINIEIALNGIESF